MLEIRRAHERGHGDHGWLDTHHTFSFSDYHDPAHMGFRVLRVMNEDRVAPGQGFGTHGHRDMEIISYVLEGSLEHKDSLGHGSLLKPGELQRITAGKGILHSEFNPSTTEAVHFYQIWIIPRATELKPSYEQRAFHSDATQNSLRLVASPDGQDGSLRIEQDARIFLASLEPGEKTRVDFQPGRYGWLQVLRGAASAGGHRLETSDGAAITDERQLEIESVGRAELMVFDLP